MEMMGRAERSVRDSARRHSEKGVLVLIRRFVPSPEGSTVAQRAAMRDFVPPGVAELPCVVLEYTAPAKKGADRERVDELIRRMGEGTVGLIVAGASHWITRSQSE